MNCVVILDITEGFVDEMMHRYKSTQTSRRLFEVLKWTTLVLTSAFVAVLFYLNEPLIGGFFGLIIIWCLFAPKLDKCLMANRLRKNPGFGSQVNFQFTQEGFRLSGKHGEGFLKWSAFSHAKILSDGILLFQGPRVFNWVPFSKIVEGSESELKNLVQAHVSQKMDH